MGKHSWLRRINYVAIDGPGDHLWQPLLVWGSTMAIKFAVDSPQGPILGGPLIA